MTTIDYLIIAIYLFGIFFVGLYAKSKVKGINDYLTAENQFSAFSLTGTLTATLIGAGTTMGIIGKVSIYGSGILWNFFGFAAGMIIFALFFADRIRKTRKRTMAEIVAGEFGRLPRFVVAIVAAIYAFSIMVIGVTGMARLITYVLDMPEATLVATIFSVTVAILLTACGGLYSVIWTDALQFIIMVVVIVILGPIIAIGKVGSLDAINTALISVGGSLADPTKNVPSAYIVFSFLSLLLSIPDDPTVPQRALAGKTVKTVKIAFFTSAIIAVFYGFALTIVGGGSMILSPNIAQEYGTSEAVLPVFIIRFFPPVLSGLGIAALLATIITTITSMLLVGTTHLVFDAGQALFPKVSDDKFRKVIPLATVLLGGVVTLISLGVDSIGSMLYFSFSLIGAFLFPLIAILYWKKATKWGISLGVLSGAMTILVMYALNIMGPGGDPVYLGLAVSLFFTVAFSLIENAVKK